MKKYGTGGQATRVTADTIDRVVMLNMYPAMMRNLGDERSTEELRAEGLAILDAKRARREWAARELQAYRDMLAKPCDVTCATTQEDKFS